MRVKFEKYVLLALAVLHLVVVASHAYSHMLAHVQNTPLQLAFIVLVIVVAPFVGVYMAWNINTSAGAGLFAVAMLAAFLFGYAFHFVVDSPDLCSNVVGKYKDIFFYSASSLAVVEFFAFIFGAYVCLVRHKNV